MRWRTGFLALLVIGLLMIGFSTCDADKNHKDSSEENSDSSEESKERDKRSDEEIMFGNQQNKANGLVDEFLMGVDGKNDDKKVAKNDTEKKDVDDSKPEEATKTDEKDEIKTEEPTEKLNDAEMVDPSSDSSEMSSTWYGGGGNANSPASSEALQYILHSHPLQPISPSNSFVDVRGVFDQADLYRRKRAPISRPVTLMKRSLRSPIGQMIRTRRLPRRSMRLKRQVDVEQILSMLRNAKTNNGDNGFYKPAQGSERFGSSFRHRNIPFSYPYGEEENARNENDEEDSSLENKDFGDGLLYPTSSRYFDVPEYPVPNHYQSKESENEVLPSWMEERMPSPSIFTVARRSTPLFYPVDYRFVPGYKKRSMMEENEEGEPPMSFGKWGRVVDVPGAYASAEDVARLYALANLLAESENSDGVMRRRSA